LRFGPAERPDKGRTILNHKQFFTFELKQCAAVMRQVDDHEVDFRDVFNQTPLMNATRMGNADLVKRLLDAGTDTSCLNSDGFNKNEMHRDGPYNRRLFFRMRQGNSIFNPNLSLRVEGHWRNIHDVLNVNMLYVRVDPNKVEANMLARIEAMADNNLPWLREWLQSMRLSHEAPSTSDPHPGQD